jgi:Na+/proline symporter
VVRDIYQKRINPQASEKRLRRFAHMVTAIVVIGAVLAALNSPEFLQDIIVFASAGLAASFLMPLILALYWRRSNAVGVIAAMLAGSGTHAVLTLHGYYFIDGSWRAYKPLGVDAFVWDIVASLVIGVIVTLMTKPAHAIGQVATGSTYTEVIVIGH